MSTSRRSGFTLIELLVVIAIIAILIALLVPAVQQVRQAAAQTQCANNLKQVGIALHSYHDATKRLPSGYYNTSPDTFYGTGWQLHVLPFLEQETLWNNTVAWLNANPASPLNSNPQNNSNPVCGYKMQMFRCPSDIRPQTVDNSNITFALTSYMACSGTSSVNPIASDGVLYSDSKVRFIDITDGTSNTIAIGERPGTGDLYCGWGFSPGNFFGPGTGDTLLGSKETSYSVLSGDLATNVGFQPPRSPGDTAEIDGAHYWSYHFGGANFLFSDGTVRFLNYSANSVFVQLSTRSGGEGFTLP